MELVSQAIYTALRDDSEATNGLRALLGNTSATPYNMFHAFVPASFQYDGGKSCLTYQFVSGTPDLNTHPTAGRTVQEVYRVNVYSRSILTVERAHKRVKWRLQGARSVTQPSSESIISKLALDFMAPTRYDEAWNVFWQTADYRAWIIDADLR